MNVVPLPARLDHQTLDQVMDAVVRVPEGRVLLDGRHVRWVDRNGIRDLQPGEGVLHSGPFQELGVEEVNRGFGAEGEEACALPCGGA